MRQILAYNFFITAFLSILSATATGRERCINLGIFVCVIIPTAAFYSEQQLEITGFSVFGLFLFHLFTRLLFRRRVILPCVRVAGFAQSLWLFIIGWLLLLLSAFLCPVEFTSNPLTPVILLLVSIGGFLNIMLYQRPEICSNGLWYGGTLHEWSNYESFSWCVKDDKTVVDVYFSEELRKLSYPSMRIVVPPENRDAAKKLLEANLVNSAPEEAKA